VVFKDESNTYSSSTKATFIIDTGTRSYLAGSLITFITATW
jgi:hypothetical protein